VANSSPWLFLQKSRIVGAVGRCHNAVDVIGFGIQVQLAPEITHWPEIALLVPE